MSQSSKPQIDVQEAIKNAICLKGSKGCSLSEIQEYISSMKIKIPDMESLKTYLNQAVEKGCLLFENGKYKIKDCTGSAAQKLLQSGKDKIMETASGAKEVGHDVGIAMHKGLLSVKEKTEEAAKDAKETSKDATRAFGAGLDSLFGKEKTEEAAKDAKETAKDPTRALSADSDSVTGKEKTKEAAKDAKETAKDSTRALGTGSDSGNVPDPGEDNQEYAQKQLKKTE